MIDTLSGFDQCLSTIENFQLSFAIPSSILSEFPGSELPIMADVLFLICDFYVFLSMVFLFRSVFSTSVYCREFYLFLGFFLSYSPVKVGNRLTFNLLPFSSEERRFAWEEFIYYCSVVLVFLVS